VITVGLSPHYSLTARGAIYAALHHSNADIGYDNKTHSRCGIILRARAAICSSNHRAGLHIPQLGLQAIGSSSWLNAQTVQRSDVGLSSAKCTCSEDGVSCAASVHKRAMCIVSQDCATIGSKTGMHYYCARYMQAQMTTGSLMHAMKRDRSNVRLPACNIKRERCVSAIVHWLL
jgi:hypothetical protein